MTSRADVNHNFTDAELDELKAFGTVESHKAGDVLVEEGALQTVQLPGERPKLWVDDRNGGVTPLKPRLYSVILQPDDGIVSLVWAGFGKGLRVYLPAELEKMPFLVEW